VADCFPWTVEDRQNADGPQVRGIDILRVTKLPDLSLDPKRYSEKFETTRANIRKGAHFKLGDVLEIAPATRIRIEPTGLYHYVEIENVGIGDYDYLPFRGWQLPQRARLKAEPGDIFIAHLWSSAGKWFMAAGDCSTVIVTNGCARLRMIRGKQDLLPHVAVGLCSEGFCVQLRGFTTGSDGLAEISDSDLLEILIPKVLSGTELANVQEHLQSVTSGGFRFSKFAGKVIAEIPAFIDPPRRKSHVSLL
jgi:type I restriction enzyme M protein